MIIRQLIEKYKSELPDLESLGKKYPESWRNSSNEYEFYTDDLNKCYDKLFIDIEYGQAIARYGENFGKFTITNAATPIIIFCYDDINDNLIHIQNYRAYDDLRAGHLPEFVAVEIDKWLINFIKNEKCSWKLKHKDMQLFNLLKGETR